MHTPTVTRSSVKSDLSSWTTTRASTLCSICWRSTSSSSSSSSSPLFSSWLSPKICGEVWRTLLGSQLGPASCFPNQAYQTKPTKPNRPNHNDQMKPTKPNLPNQTYQAKPTKPNQPNQTYQTKPTKPNLPNLPSQTCQTKPTKSKLLVKAVNAWVRSAFGNVYIHFSFCYLSFPNSAGGEFISRDRAQGQAPFCRFFYLSILLSFQL